MTAKHGTESVEEIGEVQNTDVLPIVRALRRTESRETGGARWSVNPDGRVAADAIETLVAALEQLVDKSENLVIGVAMRWDLDAMAELTQQEIDAARIALEKVRGMK
jgi:hypothetical protein